MPASTPPAPRPGPPGGHERDPWPRDFGRDGVSGLVTPERAMRARDASSPDAADEQAAERILDELLARVDGRPRGGSRGRTSDRRRG